MSGGSEEAQPTSEFYPTTCHAPLMSRRQLLASSAALLVAGVTNAGAGTVAADGLGIIQKYASIPDDPWAVCHGIRAVGRDFTVSDGRRAVDFLLEDQLASVQANGKSVLGFPLQVEVHPNMFLKTMLEAGVPLSHTFTHHGSRRTLRDVLEGGRTLFRPSEVGASANMLPWSLVAFTSTTPPAKGRWINAWDEPVELDPVVEGSLSLLEQASRPLMQAMREHRPETAKAPVHSFTCGGTHMLYALLVAMGAGYTGRDRLERTRRQVDLLVWRMTEDINLIDRFYEGRIGQNGAYWFALDAKLKLLGHAEECLAVGVQRRVLSLTPAQQERRRATAVTLRRMLQDMEDKNMLEARVLDRDLFRQLVGDTCHARRGLTLA
jgi:hypothetical protein